MATNWGGTAARPAVHGPVGVYDPENLNAPAPTPGAEVADGDEADDAAGGLDAGTLNTRRLGSEGGGAGRDGAGRDGAGREIRCGDTPAAVRRQSAVACGAEVAAVAVAARAGGLARAHSPQPHSLGPGGHSHVMCVNSAGSPYTALVPSVFTRESSYWGGGGTGANASACATPSAARHARAQVRARAHALPRATHGASAVPLAA